ncbi:M3 family oligoendopeptidase [Lapidilactobacillus achengensis]|uniref:M3 family oligoendopeptidase n=1 Tax=Lapidilactobacillus achengensis TaxID=2486000 RepID=A0ABW1UMP5_9LACO|nr:M3 family oligoendopeptidase [Lapidilactobacillus achengensis]
MTDFAKLPYARPEYEQVAQQYQTLIAALKNADDPLTAVKAALAISQLNSDVVSQQMLAYIRFSVNTLDKFYEAENDYWNEFGPKYDEFTTAYYQALVDSPYRQALRQELPETLFEMAENQIKTFSAAVIPLLQENNKISNQYSTLIAAAQIEFDGQTYNISQLGKLRNDPDRDIRRRATAATTQWFVDHETEFDTIYDQLVQIRTKIAHQLGYRDYAAMSFDFMNRFDYDEADVANYRETIRQKVVPIVNKLMARQQTRLGLDNLAFYDEGYNFPSGNALPQGTPEELVAKANEMYHEMSPETGKFFQMMVDDHNLDLLSHHGKQGGGYCEFLPKFKTPFIFANFNGTSGDVDVLTHEAGHAFQTFMAQNIKAWECIFPTNEAAEIFSMSMEFIAYPWMPKFFGEQTTKYKFEHLSSALIFLPYGVLVDHFQTEVYQHPDWTPAERKATWRRLEKMYLPSRDYSDDPDLDRGIYWYRQGHIFEAPFYYIDYTLAQVVAFQFWKRFEVDHDPQAWSDYLAMAKAGGSLSFNQLVALGHLQSPFKDGALDDVLTAIDQNLASVPESALQ